MISIHESIGSIDNSDFLYNNAQTYSENIFLSFSEVNISNSAFSGIISTNGANIV